MLKRSAKSERGTPQQSSKRTKITVQNGAEVFTETGLSGNKGVKVKIVTESFKNRYRIVKKSLKSFKKLLQF